MTSPQWAPPSGASTTMHRDGPQQRPVVAERVRSGLAWVVVIHFPAVVWASSPIVGSTLGTENRCDP
jgi:hypothetical protein